jgi:hypothetical protein
MRPPWLIVGCVTLAMVASDMALAQAERVNYIGMTKREIVRRLGLPAEISLMTGDAPVAEIWWYYWDDPYHGLTRADFQFTGNKVSGHAAFFDAKYLVSTETPEGFARVYRRVAKDRKRRGE